MNTQRNTSAKNIDVRGVSQNELLKVHGGGFFCYKHKRSGNDTRYALKGNGAHYQIWNSSKGKYDDMGSEWTTIDSTTFASYCLSKGYKHIVGY